MMSGSRSARQSRSAPGVDVDAGCTLQRLVLPALPPGLPGPGLACNRFGARLNILQALRDAGTWHLYNRVGRVPPGASRHRDRRHHPRPGVNQLRNETVSPDLLSAEHIECPYHLYQKLHRGSGVAEDPAVGVVVAGYDDLVELSKNTGLFSSSISDDGKGPRHMGVGREPVQPDVEEILALAHPLENALFTADPPEHTRHRKLISKALSPRRVRSLEPAIRESLEAAFAESGPAKTKPQRTPPDPLPRAVAVNMSGLSTIHPIRQGPGAVPSGPPPRRRRGAKIG